MLKTKDANNRVKRKEKLFNKKTLIDIYFIYTRASRRSNNKLKLLQIHEQPASKCMIHGYNNL